jgi:transitional endoplasmic reticulum ATPase
MHEYNNISPNRIMATSLNTPQDVYNSCHFEREDFPFIVYKPVLGTIWVALLASSKLFVWVLYPFFIYTHLFTKPDVSQCHTIMLSFIGILSLGILCHWIETWMSAPRADLGYPLSRVNRFTPIIHRLSLHALVYFILEASGDLHSFSSVPWFVLGSFPIFTLIFAMVDPGWGYVNYTWADHKADLKRGQERQPSTQAAQPQAATNAPVEDYSTPVKAMQAKINFTNIFGMQAVKDKLLEPGQLIIAERLQRPGTESPANGILLHGEPGNGKTVFAEALAGELKVPFVQLTYGDVSSKWVGEMPRLISNCFAFAKQHAPCVFFIDEIDSFIRSRDAAGSNEESLKITNTLLTEIVNLRDSRVVLIGATNYLANLDGAAIREGRFDYKVEITPPDEEARIGIIEKGVAKHAQHLNVDRSAMLSVAKRWNGFSVSRLLAVVKALPRYAKDKNLTDIGHAEWMGTLREVQGRNGRVPKNTKSLAELILDASTREALNMVASRLKDVSRIESLGGTLPSGVLFHGPSGTGKTAAARALAKEVGWAFLAVSGPDLIADREKISKIYAEAKDIRPTLIFIDEADDALRNRQYSSTPDLTNRMLVLMDGAEEQVKDVVFIAATNNPEQIDPALLRAGRFTEKVGFMPPPSDQIPRFVSNWLKGKSVMLDARVDAWEIAGMLEGQTIANIEGVLQYALNRAISIQPGSAALVLTLEDVQAGIRIVLAEGENIE